MTEQLPEVDLEYTHVPVDGEYQGILKAAQHEDAREIELRQLRAQLDAANQKAHTLTLQLMRATGNADALRMAMRQEITEAEKRAEQAEAERDNLRASLAEAKRFVTESGRIIAELQENLAKEREAKLHQIELQLQAVKERDELKQKYGTSK